MNKVQLYEIVKPFFQREFNPQETMKVLTHNKMIYWTWGVSEIVSFENKSLVLKVSGNHHKGYVVITLDFLDLYNVYYISNKGEKKDESLGLYFDQLVEVIDNKIERIPEYSR